MYGMINEAIKRMLTEQHGADTWELLASKASAEPHYLRMSQYPDEMTYKLVAAASEMLGAEADAIFEAFGEYWIDFASDYYDDLMAVSGDSFPELVENLNALHTRVGQMMPELRPPSFAVSDQEPNAFTLHYYSSRQGLEPMIIGLLRGLGRRFDTTVETTMLPRHEHAMFRVRYRANCHPEVPARQTGA